MFLSVLNQVVIIFMLIIIGVILTKAKVLTEKGVRNMTDMVLVIISPCVIIKSFIREFDTAVLKDLLIALLFSTLITIVFILASLLLRCDDKKKQRVLQFGIIFSNCGYMSIPLQQALLGDIGVFFASSYLTIFNIFVWSYGIILMSGDKKYLSPKKLIINPGIIGVIIGLIIFFFSIPIPSIISEPISYMASLNTPLPMIIIGYHLANSKILNGLKNLKLFIAIAMRLLILPLITLGAMYLCGIRGDLLVSLVISSCAPIGTITTMFSAKFNADTDLSVTAVSLSTILSVVTMPVVITLAKYIA